MASDYGDESGEKMLDNFTRFCEFKGEAAMRERARKIQDACDHAKSRSKTHEVVEDGGEMRVEWAKLDMAEFRTIDGYDDIKQIIEAKLRAHGVEPTWFEDKAAGRSTCSSGSSTPRRSGTASTSSRTRRRRQRRRRPRRRRSACAQTATSDRSRCERSRPARRPPRSRQRGREPGRRPESPDSRN